MQLNAIEETIEVESDDDASLYRLFGFALFVGMHFRKKYSVWSSFPALQSKFKKKVRT